MVTFCDRTGADLWGILFFMVTFVLSNLKLLWVHEQAVPRMAGDPVGEEGATGCFLSLTSSDQYPVILGVTSG